MRSLPFGEEPLRDSEKQARAEQVASYAVAGSPADFDPAIEAASIEHWLSPGGRTDGPRGGQRDLLPGGPLQQMKALRLELLPETYAICRLGPEEAVPVWATGGAFFSLTRTRGELSIVCVQGTVPEGVRCERGWRCLGVPGRLDFSMTGILASLADPLAAAGVSIFAVSTFDTDYLLLREVDLKRGVDALRHAGHQVRYLPSR